MVIEEGVVAEDGEVGWEYRSATKELARRTGICR
jgi:hypothetical protein